jgi:hypothetical protein
MSSPPGTAIAGVKAKPKSMIVTGAPAVFPHVQALQLRCHANQCVPR